MLMTKRDGLEITVILLMVCGSICIALTVAATHIGLIVW